MKKIEEIAQSGNTKLIRIELPDIPSGIKVFAKLESEEPTGSVKDRAAQRIIEEILEGKNYVLDFKDGIYVQKILKYQEGLTLIDSTSGNYGASLAYFGRAYGLEVQLVVPGNIPKRLLQKIRNEGINPIITDPLEGYHGALKSVVELAQDDRYLYVNQYDNLGNLNAHRDGTGREIWEQTKGKITHFITGVGTGGTIIGVSAYIRERNPQINVYPVHPESDFPGIQGLQPLVDGDIMSNIFKSYKYLVKEGIFVTAVDAGKWWDWLRSQDFNVGLSSGANIAAVVKLIKDNNIRNGTILTLFPDHLDRYRDFIKV